MITNVKYIYIYLPSTPSYGEPSNGAGFVRHEPHLVATAVQSLEGEPLAISQLRLCQGPNLGF